MPSEKIFIDLWIGLWYRTHMKLNIKKIDRELERLDKSWFWLAKELKMSWQRVRYWKRTASIRGADPIAKVFKIDPKDLIK
jgi:hypothetical protein